MAKKFNVCIMNPPYNGSLHLRFLEKTIQYCKLTCTIQPTRWLEDPLAKYKKSDYKKFEKTISRHIKSLDIIDKVTSTKEFNDDIHTPFNLGIYLCDEIGGYLYKKDYPLLDKIISQLKLTIADKMKTMKPSTGVQLVHFLQNQLSAVINCPSSVFEFYEKERYVFKDGKRLDNGLSFYENRLKTAWGNVKVKSECGFIKFDTIEECFNFISYCKLYLMKYLTLTINSQLPLYKFLPLMDDYKREYRDEDLYEFFNITPLERKEIELTVDRIELTVKEESEKINERERNYKKKNRPQDVKNF